MSAAAEVLVPGLWPGPEHGTELATPPVLARVLGRGRLGSSDFAAWEDVVASRLGFRHGADGRRRWLAIPVALQTGMTDMVATAVEDLDAFEADALLAAALPEVAAIGGRIWQVAAGLFELELEGQGRWDQSPPSTGLGRPMRAPPLDSPAARKMQVLANAVQMLWFRHPVNASRLARGRLPVQGLWFWSAGMPVTATAVHRIAGGGSVTRWLAEAAGVRWSADPLDPSAELAVVLSLSRDEHRGRREELLQSLCADLVAPLLLRQRAGDVDALILHDPGCAMVRLDRADWRRFWRPPRRLTPLGDTVAAPR